MLALLRTRRWIVFSGAVLVGIVGFGLLSAWQWHRAEIRAAEAAELADASVSTPVPWVSAGAPDSPPLAPWQPVTATGRYDAAGQLLVRNRPQAGRAGFWVLTPLITEEGVGWVNRGWMPATSAASAVVRAPDPPPGEVEVTGQWLPSDSDGWVDPVELPRGQVTAVDVPRLPNSVGSRVFDGYVVLTASQLGEIGLEPITRPQPDPSRNISYAVQWLIFALIAISGWVLLLRRENREAQAALADQAN